MDQHKFNAFLRSRQWSDPLGPQVVYHALGDRTLPDAGSWQQLKAYLMEREASAETLSAAEYIWQQYDASTPGKAR